MIGCELRVLVGTPVPSLDVTIPVNVIYKRNSSSEKASKNNKRYKESNCKFFEVEKGNRSLEG